MNNETRQETIKFINDTAHSFEEENGVVVRHYEGFLGIDIDREYESSDKFLVRFIFGCVKDITEFGASVNSVFEDIQRLEILLSNVRIYDACTISTLYFPDVPYIKDK